MRRREFLSHSTCGAVAMGLPLAAYGQQEDFDLSAVPNFCSHEHWSLTTIGSANLERKRGITPPSPVDLRFFIPYGRRQEDIEACRKFWATQRRQYGLGGDFECIRRGIHALHGQDIAEDDAHIWFAASESIANAYRDLNGWTPRAMEQAHLSVLLRTVVPQYYTLVENEAEAEREKKFTHTLLRLDPILTMFPAPGAKGDDPFIQPTPSWWNSRWVPIMPPDWRKELIDVAGFIPRDATTWRAFLAKIFDVAEAGGCRGLKDMAAKMRPLKFEPRADGDVPFDGVRSFEDAIVFQDWLWHEIAKLASDRNWPWQVHTGTTTLFDSNPLLLEPTIRRFPKVKWVLIHCWPYLSECGFLARLYPNVWVDTCWLPMLNPHFFRRAIREWLPYIPHHKIHCGHDAHSVEVATGSSLVTRQILTEILTEYLRTSGMKHNEVLNIAHDLLHNNAVDVYKAGERIEA